MRPGEGFGRLQKGGARPGTWTKCTRCAGAHRVHAQDPITVLKRFFCNGCLIRCHTGHSDAGGLRTRGRMFYVLIRLAKQLRKELTSASVEKHDQVLALSLCLGAAQAFAPGPMLRAGLSPRKFSPPVTQVKIETGKSADLVQGKITLRLHLTATSAACDSIPDEDRACSAAL